MTITKSLLCYLLSDSLLSYDVLFRPFFKHYDTLSTAFCSLFPVLRSLMMFYALHPIPFFPHRSTIVYLLLSYRSATAKLLFSCFLFSVLLFLIFSLGTGHYAPYFTPKKNRTKKLVIVK